MHHVRKGLSVYSTLILFIDLLKTLARSNGKDQMFWQPTVAFISE